MQYSTSLSIICLAVLTLAGCAAADQEPAADNPSAAEPVAATPAETAPVTDSQPAEQTPPTASSSQGQSIAGWYMEHAGQGMLQTCGDSMHLSLSGETEMLRSKAKAFGLQENTPVYVRLSAVRSASGKAIEVLQVEQFGSDTPVRDCALDGVVMPTPADEEAK